MSRAPAPDSVESLVLAGGSGTRLGLGPKAFVKLGSATLLEIALHTMLQISSKVIVALPVERLDEAKKGLSDPRILWIGGGPRRIDTLRLLVEHSQADWLVLHDVVHPFVTAELANEVLKAAYPSGAAAAALPLHEFLYDARGEQVARPGQAFSVQKPIAFRRSAIAEGFAKADRLGVSHDASALEILALAGVLPTFVEGFPWNQKITYEVDIEFSGALLSKLPKNTEFKI